MRIPANLVTRQWGSHGVRFADGYVGESGPVGLELTPVNPGRSPGDSMSTGSAANCS